MKRAFLPLLLLAACRSDTIHRTDYASVESEPVVSAASLPAYLGHVVPDFALPDLDGVLHRLSDYRGNRVVLEWINPECPFTDFSHTHGALHDLPRRSTEKGIVWIAINSGGEDKMGVGMERNRGAAKRWGLEQPILLDRTGEVGRLLDATTTPAFFIIDEQGVLVYEGALDNAPFGKVPGGGEVINFVQAALDDLAAGRAVAIPSRQSYGCRVKYAQPVLSR
jgi:hypothetical protein